MAVIGAPGSASFHSLQFWGDMKEVWNIAILPGEESSRAVSVERANSSVKSEVQWLLPQFALWKNRNANLPAFRDTVGGNLLKVCKLFSFIIFIQCYLAKMRALVNNYNHGLEFIIVRHLLFNKFTLGAFVAPSLVSSTLVKVPDQIFDSI